MVKENLVGKKFNLLSVIKETEKRIAGSPVWECLCDCGNTTYVSSKDIKRGTTKSCGCYKKDFRRIDLDGKKFNRLTAIERIGDVGSIWRCQCECGKETTATTVELTKGHKKSCGCLLKYDLIGKKFDRLTVISVNNERRGRYRKWNCVCDCGNEAVVTTNNLMSGGTTSCGCKKKEMSRLNGRRNKIYHKYGTPFRHIINNYKKRAESKNLEFTLTDEQFYELNKGSCYYCGVEPTHVLNYRGEEYNYNGIDRLNSSIGYTVNNTVSCCSTCNYAKRDMSVEDFMSWIERFKNR